MKTRTNAATFRELVEASREETTKFASEVQAELYQGLLKLPPIQLPDGTMAHVEAYYAPQVDDDGERHCGIDVRLPSGDLLEFTVKNTGWERSFAAAQSETPQQKSHHR
jgi:hypothetical protein